MARAFLFDFSIKLSLKKMKLIYIKSHLSQGVYFKAVDCKSHLFLSILKSKSRSFFNSKKTSHKLRAVFLIVTSCSYICARHVIFPFVDS